MARLAVKDEVRIDNQGPYLGQLSITNDGGLYSWRVDLRFGPDQDAPGVSGETPIVVRCGTDTYVGSGIIRSVQYDFGGGGSAVVTGSGRLVGPGLPGW